MNTQKRLLAGVLMSVCAITALAGCSDQPTDMSAVGSTSSSDQEAGFQDMEPAIIDGGVRDGAIAQAGAEESNTPEPVLVYSANATIITSDPSGAGEDFTAFIEAKGGRIDYMSRSQMESGQSSWFNARVPADQFESTVAELSQFGDVREVNTNTDDVGLEKRDVEARVAALEASIARLRELLDQADSTEAVIQAESELTNRQAELDALNSQREYLEDQIAMSGINVAFETPDAYQAPRSGLWDAFLSSLVYLGYGVVVAVPWLVVLGLIGWGVFAWWRRRRANSSDEEEIVALSSEEASEPPAD